MTQCPGCGHPTTRTDDCDTCEYFNLASGRYHYCGLRSCYCRGLRRTIRAEVLAQFAADFEAAYDGRPYRDMAAERLGLGSGKP